MTKGTKARAARFKIGAWVSFPYGAQKVIAQIIEDRGPLGFKGSHIYRIRLDREDLEPDMFEVSEASLTAVPVPDKAAIMKYLKEGGLVALLQLNLLGGRNPPKVWLSYTREGELTPTLLAQRGVIGGVTVPFFALHEYKVFAGKEGQVVDFLANFGLTRHEAEEVIAAVGTGP